MDKEFSYNPQIPCIVLHNGQDVGALVAGRLYRFDSSLTAANLHTEAEFLVDNVLFQYGEPIGHLEGRRLIIDSRCEILELVEA
ncbi:hypothetical protein [Pseudomonas sp. NPDC087615]|uniref:hypothetical protein n=1 Tax=Pseudomonas sp. NPDC087615 TaxID=3364443 RepID=UPI0037F5A49F